MTTAEKRAQLEAEGEAWPDCECHGEPKYWDSDGFRCAVRKRANTERRRQAFRNAGSCVFCGGPLESSSKCAGCLEAHREAVWRHEQTPYRQMRKQLNNIRSRRQRSDFQPLGVGLAAFAAYMKQPGS